MLALLISVGLVSDVAACECAFPGIESLHAASGASACCTASANVVLSCAEATTHHVEGHSPLRLSAIAPLSCSAQSDQCASCTATAFLSPRSDTRYSGEGYISDVGLAQRALVAPVALHLLYAVFLN